MKLLNFVFLAMVFVYVALFFLFGYNSGRLRKVIITNSLSGVLLLIILMFIKDYAGFAVFFNLYTLMLSVIWGIPGVIIHIVLNIILL